MIWKIFPLLGVAVAALGEHPVVSEYKVLVHHPVHYGHHGKLSHVGSHAPEHHEEYAWTYPSYEYSYHVDDPHTHDHKGHEETRHGDEVKGMYWLIQPDGRKRTVKYHADKHSGFKADVEYSEPIYHVHHEEHKEHHKEYHHLPVSEQHIVIHHDDHHPEDRHEEHHEPEQHEPEHHEPEHHEPEHHEPEHHEPEHHEPEHHEPEHHEPEHHEPEQHEAEHHEPEHQEPEHHEAEHHEPELHEKEYYVHEDHEGHNHRVIENYKRINDDYFKHGLRVHHNPHIHIRHHHNKDRYHHNYKHH